MPTHAHGAWTVVEVVQEHVAQESAREGAPRRSGGRSRMAAEAMAAAGYRRCLNVAEGFEGPIDADRHRSQIAGWKFARLAWVQG